MEKRKPTSEYVKVWKEVCVGEVGCGDGERGRRKKWRRRKQRGEGERRETEVLAMTWDGCSRSKTAKDNLIQVHYEILLEYSSPTPILLLLLYPQHHLLLFYFCCHSVQPSPSLLQYPNEKKLVGKSWTQSYINLQPSHGTAQGEGD